jgi:hypothetical protein
MDQEVEEDKVKNGARKTEGRKDRRTLAKVNVIDWRFFQAGD